MIDGFQRKRAKFMAMYVNIAKADQQNNKERIKSTTPEIAEDSKLRKEIHQFISQQRAKVGSRKELLQLLIETFSDEKYHKYQKYFENWVKDAIKEDKGR